MAHGLICGMSESGKTTLAKQLAASLSRQSQNVLVLDPMNDPEWTADFRTTDSAAFLDVFWTNQKCMVFIDESAQMVGRYDTLMQETATRGRHHGHSVFFICQRGAQISATVRAQCRHLYLFCSAKDDCKILANEFNQQELLRANSLPQFAFYHASRFGGCSLLQLKDPRDVRSVQPVRAGKEESTDDPPESSTGATGDTARRPLAGTATGTDPGTARRPASG